MSSNLFISYKYIAILSLFFFALTGQCEDRNSGLLLQGEKGFIQDGKSIRSVKKNCRIETNSIVFSQASCLELQLNKPVSFGKGYIDLTFSPITSLADGKEHCLLDMAVKGNGLRIWVTRTGLLAINFIKAWKNVFWITVNAKKFEPGKKSNIVVSCSQGTVQVYINGKKIYKKDQVSLPASSSQKVVLSSFNKGKADFQGRIFDFQAKDGEYKAVSPKKVSASSYSKPVKRTIVPELGLNIHTRYSPREIPVVSKTGAKYVRFHYTWKEVEKTKGKYELPASAFKFMDEVKKSGLDVLMMLAYGNKLYNKPGSKPGFGELKGQNSDFAVAFGKYCRWMVKTFGSKGTGQVNHWEVWNEQNEAPAEDFIPVLKAASENIRAEDPKAVIIFGGISRMDYAFLKKCLELGAAEYVDGFAFHPYRESTWPENTFQSQRRFNGSTHSYANELLEFRKLFKLYSKNNKEIPLWITELGYWTTDSETHLDANNSVSHDLHAKYLLRSIIQNMAFGIDKYFIYRAVDSSHFGLTYGPKYLPRPGYFSLQFLLQKFPQRKPVEVLDSNIKLSLQKKTRNKLLKVYEKFDPHAYAFRVDDKTVQIYYWNAGATKRDVYSDGNVALVNMELPFCPENEQVLQYDLFYGSSRKSYNNGEWKSSVIKTPTGCRIENLKYYDAPVLLELTVRK